MDFKEILDKNKEGKYDFPFAAKTKNGDWLKGNISVDFLNDHFGQYSTADEMINATDSEGLKKYFQWLKDEGILK